MIRNLNLFAGLIAASTLGACDAAIGNETNTQDAAAADQQEAAATPQESEETAAVSRNTAVDELDEFLSKQEIDTSRPGWKERMPRPPQATFAEGDEYFWELHTNKGDITIKLMPDVAPMHVSSTIYLTRAGFYDELSFHRVIPGFMAQGGCPQGSGRGGPGYSYGGETDPEVKHDRPGLLSMANTGRPNSDGSQFFLTFVPTPHLDGKHTVFGEIVEGMDVMKKLEAAGTSPYGKTTEPLTLEKSEIRVEVGADS